jgi:hypothetical protein
MRVEWRGEERDGETVAKEGRRCGAVDGERERERERQREREREGRERREEAVAWREEVGGDGLKGGSRLSPDLA